MVYLLSFLLLISLVLNIRYFRAYHKAQEYNKRLFVQLVLLRAKYEPIEEDKNNG